MYRFFLVKDGFLMYYDVNEKKDYERRDYFNIHPKVCFFMSFVKYNAILLFF